MLIEDNSLQSKTKPSVKPSIQSAMEAVLGVSEWLIAALLLLGFWNKELGILGALGSCATFVSTVTIIPFMPNGLGSGCRVSGDGGQRPFLGEGCGSAGRIVLFAEARCDESVTFRTKSR
jgi:uncharacterized membrane protein YkgB